MNPVETTIALSELVTRRPDVAPVLEALGLDYCCGGTRSLTEACADAGLDVDEVVTRLSEESPADAPADWASLGPAELVDHIEHIHHSYLGHALPRLSELLSRVIDAHAERHPELHDVRATFEELRRDLEPHLEKEEEILFPMIRELHATQGESRFHSGSLQAPIGVMRLEHDRAGELLARLRAQTSAYTPPSDGCASYQALYTGLAELEADTHLHIHKENNLLFPAVVS
ncbi:MAG: iron-sulfur cluster repair di-iron protein [Acidimicrobiia bacterium]|nr:iron-sulfur cluster repair di-iron protein [Acidimicrobiia bacterium]